MPRTLLSAGLLDLCGLSNPDQSVMRLKLLQRILGVVDEGEASTLSTTVLCPETENHDLVLLCFVEFGKFGSELVFRDIRTVGVKDITRRILSGSLPRENIKTPPSDTIFLINMDVLGRTYTTICFLDRSALRKNLRVRSVTGCSRSAMISI